MKHACLELSSARLQSDLSTDRPARKHFVLVSDYFTPYILYEQWALLLLKQGDGRKALFQDLLLVAWSTAENEMDSTWQIAGAWSLSAVWKIANVAFSDLIFAHHENQRFHSVHTHLYLRFSAATAELLRKKPCHKRRWWLGRSKHRASFTNRGCKKGRSSNAYHEFMENFADC